MTMKNICKSVRKTVSFKLICNVFNGPVNNTYFPYHQMHLPCSSRITVKFIFLSGVSEKKKQNQDHLITMNIIQRVPEDTAAFAQRTVLTTCNIRL
jgi:hypothetical protein